MASEIEAYANRIVAREILRRGRILSDKAIRQERHGDIAWRVLLVGMSAVSISAILLVALAVVASLLLPLVSSLRSTYQHHVGKKRFYAIHRLEGPTQYYVPAVPAPAEEAYGRGVFEKLDRTGNPDSWPAQLSGQDGALFIVLRINRDGSLSRATVGHSSAQPDLDKRACEIAVAAAPFEPFPEGLEGKSQIRIASYMVFNYGAAPPESLLPITNNAPVVPRPDWLPSNAQWLSGPICDLHSKRNISGQAP